MQLSQILMCENRIVYFSLKLYCRLGQIILADFLTKRHVTKKYYTYYRITSIDFVLIALSQVL